MPSSKHACRKADPYSKSFEELGRRAALSSSFLVAEQQPSSDIWDPAHNWTWRCDSPFLENANQGRHGMLAHSSARQGCHGMPVHDSSGWLQNSILEQNRLPRGTSRIHLANKILSFFFFLARCQGLVQHYPQQYCDYYTVQISAYSILIIAQICKWIFLWAASLRRMT